jgi:hypothetical protein
MESQNSQTLSVLEHFNEPNAPSNPTTEEKVLEEALPESSSLALLLPVLAGTDVLTNTDRNPIVVPGDILWRCCLCETPNQTWLLICIWCGLDRCLLGRCYKCVSISEEEWWPIGESICDGNNSCQCFSCICTSLVPMSEESAVAGSVKDSTDEQMEDFEIDTRLAETENSKCVDSVDIEGSLHERKRDV